MIALHELPIISKLVTILMDRSPIVEAPQRTLKNNYIRIQVKVIELMCLVS